MRISDLIKMGLRNLGRRKARTALTIIGVVIGTISIMLMVAIGQGINENFEKQIMENGSMTIIQIYANGYGSDGDGNWSEYKQKLDNKLIEQIREINHVKAVSPMIYKYLNLNSGKYQGGVSVQVMDCSTFEDFGFPALSHGKLPTPDNNEILVLGSDAATYFYGYRGNRYEEKEVNWDRDRITFTFDDYYYPDQPGSSRKKFTYLIKDYARFAQTDQWQYSYNCYMDYDFYKKLYTEYANTLKPADKKKALESLQSFETIQINVDNMKYVTEVEEQIQALGFRTESDMQYIQPMVDTADMLQKIFLVIGAVAFVVAAINIANTMIMSIYERTKEIGIMKVLGCFIRDIKRLFLFEAGIIGCIGGLFGVGLSFLASYLLNTYGGTILGSLMSITGTMAEDGAKYCVIPFWLPFASVILAVFVGVFSGYLPARRATKISAIEAMKNEN